MGPSDGLVCVHVPITAAACVCLKSDHQVVASGTEHVNADRCLGHNLRERLAEELELSIKIFFSSI